MPQRTQISCLLWRLQQKCLCVCPFLWLLTMDAADRECHGMWPFFWTNSAAADSGSQHWGRGWRRKPHFGKVRSRRIVTHKCWSTPPPPLPLSDEATCTTLDSIAALQGVIPPQVFGDGDRDVVLQLTLAPGESVNLTIICVDVPVSMCACMCVRMNFCWRNWSLQLANESWKTVHVMWECGHPRLSEEAPCIRV